MNVKHALTKKGLSTLLLGAIVLASSCKKDDAEVMAPNEMPDSTLSASIKPEGIMATGTVSSANLLINSTFEETDALSKWQSEANPGAITRSNTVAKAGSYAAKFSINKSDALVSGSYRAEIKHDILPKGAERWYGMSVFLPTSYAKDPIPESIFQWHNVPNFGAGENWGKYKFNNPWRLETNNGRLRFVHQFNTVASDPNSSISSKSYDLGEYKLGEWIDFVVHFKATHTSDGIFELWKNGTKVMTISGPGVYYNDETGPYMKMGIYKWGWSGTGSTVTNRTLYWDEIKMGNENSSYNEVAQNSSSTPSPEPAPAPEPTPTPAPTPTTPVVFAVNGGGSAFTASNGIAYQADKYFSGGFGHSVTAAISNTTDDQLFQTGHYGTTFGYAVPIANGTYDVTFGFVENYNSAIDTRLFDVVAEGSEVISNLDIYKVAGKNKAYFQTKTISVTDGTLNLNFKGDKGDAMVSSFHIAKSGSTTAPAPTPTNQVAFAVNGGGTAFTASNGIAYQADKNFSGGFPHAVTAAISNTTDDQLFQTGHYGTTFSYAVPVSNGTYDVVLNFVENYNSASGLRQFDVLSEGSEVISNLDIFSVAGKNKPHTLTRTVSVTDGTLNLIFRSDKGDAMVSAFHLIKK